jgi:hypothetical protein
MATLPFEWGMAEPHIFSIHSRVLSAGNANKILFNYNTVRPVTVAARFKAWSVFTRLNAGIMGSNITQGMDVCLSLFCWYRYRSCDGLILHLRSPIDRLRINKLKWHKSVSRIPYSPKWGQQERERERVTPFGISVGDLIIYYISFYITKCLLPNSFPILYTIEWYFETDV